MNSYVALLRGINVGGKSSLPMKELVEVLESVGCRDVKTYIQSGNAVFRSSAGAAQLAKGIGGEIQRRRGFAPHVLVLSKADFKRALDNNPFGDPEAAPTALHLGFLDAVPPKPDLESLEALRAPSERFELIGQVFYLLAPEGVGRSKLAKKSEKALGVPLTDRNWKTAGSVMALLDALDD